MNQRTDDRFEAYTTWFRHHARVGRIEDEAPDHDGGETALRRQIADYLTKQFIWDRVSELPVDECLSEADHILALIAAHAAPSTGNDGGADAVDIAYDCLRFRKEDPHKLSETVERIVAALVQYAADERKRCVAICDEKNAAMIARGEYEHGYWDACNEIKAAIAAAGHKQGGGEMSDTKRGDGSMADKFDPILVERCAKLIEHSEAKTSKGFVRLVLRASKHADLVAALRECADDLEAELRARYCFNDSPEPHPSMKRQFDRDMTTVVTARAALAAAGHKQGSGE